MYSIDFIMTRKKVCVSVHYKRSNSYLCVNGKEVHKFKANDSDILETPLCLANISKDWSVDNMKKTELNDYVYDFCVDYHAIVVDDIYAVDDILKVFSEIEYDIKKLRLVKKLFYAELSIL